MQTGRGGPGEFEFFPEGKFLNAERPGGKPIKQDGFPAYRRVSAILCIEEKFLQKYPHPLDYIFGSLRNQACPNLNKAGELHYSQDNKMWIEHDVLVLHNPYAYHPLSQEPWKELPQFVPINSEMKWTDGACFPDR